jgi:7,8-dihydropterin-6-yl-methyl-4-(beta-D-ribofuranosyl)aminobenzene 5'-phosphate synthase
MDPRSEPLDELVAVVVVDNETDTLSSVDAGVPQQPELAAIIGRTPARTLGDGHRAVTVFDQLCVACHGLSVLITARRGSASSTVLFDVGPDGAVWLANASRLGVDLAGIATIFLSHWHADHSGGMVDVVAAVSAARAAAGLATPVVDLHPDRPDQRGLMGPGGILLLLPPEPTLDALRAAGGAVELHGEAHLVADGLVAASGAIDRVTAYETGLPGHHSIRGDEVEPDPLIADERYLAAEVRGRGVTVFSACSHAGIVNACLGARAQFGEAPVDLVLGGFHLAGGSMEGRIPETAHDLEELVAPRFLAPGHCTGWRAKAALAARFAPGRYAPSAVGTRYALEATD